jgi:hypothetical protein
MVRHSQEVKNSSVENNDLERTAVLEETAVLKKNPKEEKYHSFGFSNSDFSTNESNVSDFYDSMNKAYLNNIGTSVSTPSNKSFKKSPLESSEVESEEEVHSHHDSENTSKREARYSKYDSLVVDTSTPKDFSISLFGTIFGLSIDTKNTVRKLFENSTPPHLLSLFVILLIAIFCPPIFYFINSKTDVITVQDLARMYIVFNCMFIFLSILNYITLIAFGVRASLIEVTASIVYSLTPLSLVLLILYSFNYVNSGNLTLIPYFLSGKITNSQDPTLKVLPYALSISGLILLYVYMHCVKYLGYMHYITALFTLILSVIPVGLSIILTHMTLQLIFLEKTTFISKFQFMAPLFKFLGIAL